MYMKGKDLISVSQVFPSESQTLEHSAVLGAWCSLAGGVSVNKCEANNDSSNSECTYERPFDLTIFTVLPTYSPKKLYQEWHTYII